MTDTGSAEPTLDAGELTLDVDDRVLAKIAAYEATLTPGVARLHPYAVQAARNAVSSVARTASARLTGAQGAAGTSLGAGAGAADPAAVDIDHNSETGAVSVTVRVVASTRPPILQVAGDLQKRINARITELTGITPVLIVINVLDVDPPEPV